MAEGVDGPAPGVLPDVVVVELAGRAEEGPEEGENLGAAWQGCHWREREISGVLVEGFVGISSKSKSVEALEGSQTKRRGKGVSQTITPPSYNKCPICKIK